MSGTLAAIIILPVIGIATLVATIVVMEFWVVLRISYYRCPQCQAPYGFHAVAAARRHRKAAYRAAIREGIENGKKVSPVKFWIVICVNCKERSYFDPDAKPPYYCPIGASWDEDNTY